MHSCKYHKRTWQQCTARLTSTPSSTPVLFVLVLYLPCLETRSILADKWSFHEDTIRPLIAVPSLPKHCWHEQAIPKSGQSLRLSLDVSN